MGFPGEVEGSRAALTASAIVDLLLAAGRLKNLPRTGWRLAGIKECESVADHNFRVALIALLLGELVEGVDQGKLLRMAVLHDLPESVTTDLPLAAVKTFGREAKQQAERDAWRQLLPPGGQLDEWLDLWEEFEKGESVEARLARAADRLERLLQAYEYEGAGRRNLEGFWREDVCRDLEFEMVRSIFGELRKRRAGLASR